MWGHDDDLMAWGVWGHGWCSDAWGVWGLLAKLECILLHASVCSRLLKWLNQTTQVVQSAYSSGSIRLLKWLNQRVQPSA
ncbi:hypothetical protein DW064_15325 [Segatella copri]|uniref:Uncharacterized protein n=1 Tax=Segatella copri TaxID=165179 RepID=A0AA92V4J3_9BACT|nr:hypothetical protein DW064_15325 [Segatella copri]